MAGGAEDFYKEGAMKENKRLLEIGAAILLTALPVQAISDYINASSLGAHFLESNFITSIIKAAL